MKTKIKNQKVNLKNWLEIKQIHSTVMNSFGVKQEFEIQIFYPPINEVIQRKTFTYSKEKDMMADYQKLIIKVLLNT